ncbi:Protein of unknown function [Clostridium cavendishii DSM 21758]|uniref:DUF2752 domain-containing protein n=1 Tax=Clostridium cavendishii DSM 21758 TaxID=1121302 RepID=A0A1M6CGM2_9CLOT|nr:DUF2752 domain-containing protein [Clostridium cavendishii]SHI59838.1 Protein of unknown function [Clostridium cavendishii DSM 21758]
MSNFKLFLKNNFILIICIALFIILTKGMCIIKAITGIPCPGCGLTRAHLALLRLDFKTAFHYHPLFFIVIPFIIFLISADKPLLGSKRNELFLYTLIASLFIGVYIYRMYTLFPTTAPMNVDDNSISMELLKLIKLII